MVCAGFSPQRTVGNSPAEIDRHIAAFAAQYASGSPAAQLDGIYVFVQLRHPLRDMVGLCGGNDSAIWDEPRGLFHRAGRANSRWRRNSEYFYQRSDGRTGGMGRVGSPRTLEARIPAGAGIGTGGRGRNSNTIAPDGIGYPDREPFVFVLLGNARRLRTASGTSVGGAICDGTICGDEVFGSQWIPLYLSPLSREQPEPAGHAGIFGIITGGAGPGEQPSAGRLASATGHPPRGQAPGRHPEHIGIDLGRGDPGHADHHYIRSLVVLSVRRDSHGRMVDAAGAPKHAQPHCRRGGQYAAPSI